MGTQTKKYLICYGSLKRGEFNYKRFPGQKYLKSIELNGYELFNLGSYPAASEGDGKIQVQIHEISESSAREIEGMEASAGYYPKLLSIEIDGQKIEAPIYLWKKSEIIKYGLKDKKIINGNWTKKN